MWELVEKNKNFKSQLLFVIVGDWEDLNYLKQLTQQLNLEKNIYFTGWLEFKKALKMQSLFDIHIHSSLPGWWLSWTLVQGLYLCPIVVASLNEGAEELKDKNLKFITIWKNYHYSINDVKIAIENGITQFLKWKDFRHHNKPLIEKLFGRDKNIKKYYLEFRKLYNE